MSTAALQPGSDGRSLTWRVFHTPLAELLHGHVGPATDADRVIAAANLPAALADLVRLVVRGTRLWRREKVNVARELVAHFEDGLATGANAEDLRASFGDPRQAAKLIRRAKRRNRPLIWKVLKLVERMVGILVLLLVVIYVVEAARIYGGRTNITRNYMAEWNAATVRVPEDQRAWPVYREAALALGEWPEQNKDADLRPGGAGWPAMAEFVSQHARSVELIRQAAAMPELGWILSASIRDEDAPLLNPRQGTQPARAPAQPAVENPDFMSFLLPPLAPLRNAARLLSVDAYLAAEVSEGERALQDLQAILQIAEHARQTRFLVGDLIAVAIVNKACSTAGTLLRDHPQLLTDEQLAVLAHELAAVCGGTLRVRFDSERACIEDLLQRYWTDDGHGDGLLRPDLLRALAGADAAAADQVGAAPAWLLPLVSPIMAGRRELHARFTAILDGYEAEAATPLWERGEHSVDAQVEALASAPLDRIRYLPLSIMSPALGRASRIGELAVQSRDATLVAIALELYHRRHGVWPAKLAELAPQLLPQVPPDRYDGRSIKYRVIDGQPLLYSVGADRKDDNGRLPEPKDLGPNVPDRRARANALARAWLPPPEPNRPPGAAPPDGDWVLWPPVE